MYIHLCTTAIRYVFSFMSMFLHEYIAIKPQAKEIFEMQNEDVKGLLRIYDYRKK